MIEAKKWISPTEYRQWLAYDAIHPLGPDADDTRNVLIHFIARALGFKMPLSELMPHLARQVLPKTPAEIEAEMMLWARSHNQRKDRKK